MNTHRKEINVKEMNVDAYDDVDINVDVQVPVIYIKNLRIVVFTMFSFKLRELACVHIVLNKFIVI